MKKVLFICSGNISRSPVAACILQKMLNDKNCTDVVVDSAGTHNLFSEPYDSKMIDVAQRHGYTLSGVSKQMNKEILTDATLILAMDFSHYVKVQQLLPYPQWYKLDTFCNYCFGVDSIVEDPFCGSDELYERVFQLIENGCQIIADKITA